MPEDIKPEETLPPAPPASPAAYPPTAPPAPVTTGLRKHHYGMILGGAVVLLILMHMMSGPSTSSSTTAADGSTPAATADGSTPATDATAPAAAASSDNPLIGNWTLEASEADKTYCGTHEEFKKDSVIETKAGVATSYAAIYLIKPTYVDVAENGDLAHYGEWDLTNADEITFRINSLYVAASCLYHRD